jgi:hypothetical protein
MKYQQGDLVVIHSLDDSGDTWEGTICGISVDWGDQPATIWIVELWFWWNPEPGNPRYVINFPTKENWRNPSKLEWISAGLADLKNRVMMIGIESIAIPALGCANGGLRFEDVRPLIEEKLNDLEIPVLLYEPQ